MWLTLLWAMNMKSRAEKCYMSRSKNVKRHLLYVHFYTQVVIGSLLHVSLSSLLCLSLQGYDTMGRVRWSSPDRRDGWDSTGNRRHQSSTRFFLFLSHFSIRIFWNEMKWKIWLSQFVQKCVLFYNSHQMQDRRVSTDKHLIHMRSPLLNPSLQLSIKVKC